MKLALAPISFLGKPKNYAIVDRYVSRSAQPQADDFAWLKAQGVTDIFNFRTMYAPDINFDEKAVVEGLGMNYHLIPTNTKEPTEKGILIFLDGIKKVIKNGGKAHIHCKAGADRTGMYTYVYKSVNGIGDRVLNQLEMLQYGHNTTIFPNLIPWVNELINKMLKTLKK